MNKEKSKKDSFSLGSPIKISAFPTKSEKHISTLVKDKSKHGSTKLLRAVNTSKKVPERSKKAATVLSSAESKSILSKHPDVDIIKTQAKKKFDVSQIPSISISTVKRDKVDADRGDIKEMNKKSINILDDDDDVICID